MLCAVCGLAQVAWLVVLIGYLGVVLAVGEFAYVGFCVGYCVYV